MSAETVTNKIEEKARAAAETIITEAKEKAASEREVIINDAKLRAEKMLDNAKQNAQIAEKGRAQADAMSIKLGVLGTKRDMLNKAKSDAKARLVKMDKDSFVKIFSKYLAASELSGEYELIPSAAHREFCTATVKELEKAGGITLAVSERDSHTDSGFVLSNESYEVEFSVDAILDEVFEQNEKAIADILFETGDVK